MGFINRPAKLKDTVMWLEKDSVGFLLPADQLAYFSVTGTMQAVINRVVGIIRSSSWLELFEETLEKKMTAGEMIQLENFLKVLATYQLIHIEHNFQSADELIFKENHNFGIFGELRLVTPNLEITNQFEVYAYKAGGTAGECTDINQRDDDGPMCS